MVRKRVLSLQEMVYQFEKRPKKTSRIPLGYGSGLERRLRPMLENRVPLHENGNLMKVDENSLPYP